VTAVGRHFRSGAVQALIILALLGSLLGASNTLVLAAPCDPPIANPILCENTRPGTPRSTWDLPGAGVGDTSIQGFATDISYNKGTTATFKISTPAAAYRLDIYRLGYYQGNGARLIATVTPSATLPQAQPPCLSDPSTGLTDCGNWATSATWAIPSTAISGIYIAKLTRTDTGGASHIVFVVRDDASTAPMLFQTSDTTWQAYNLYGGNSLYAGGPGTNPGRAYKVSYNRPFDTRSTKPQSWVFTDEYPMLRWLEANGYNMTYAAGIDSDRDGAARIQQHRVFVSVGHDEYWSANQRANVEAARNAGVNMAFFSGNESFWKTRYENSLDSSHTAYRTLVSYKETHANARIDPADPPTWTGTWRDPLVSPPADGGRPENAMTGQMFMVNGDDYRALVVPYADSRLRFWRNTSVASLAPGQSTTLTAGCNCILGYEWDMDVDNGSRPAGLFQLSSSSYTVNTLLQDFGSTYGSGQATHSLTLYRASSGALVFGAGTVDYAWALDGNHDVMTSTPEPILQQATVNLFGDMGVQPGSLQAGLVPAGASTDTVKPSSTITAPGPGATLHLAAPVTISGTAADSGGQVAGVEVSVDSGTTWHRANGTTAWTYTWTPSSTSQVTLKSRAVDDSGNIETPGAGVTVGGTQTTGCPCTIWSQSTAPADQSSADPNPVEVGVKFSSDTAGFITGIRFYKLALNGGTHIGSLWSSTGAMLASATFANESASGWQQANFATPVPITANTTYVASYHMGGGQYAGDLNYFATGVDSPPLHALSNAAGGGNGVYAYGNGSTFPSNTFQSSNYWVDVAFTSTTGTPTPVPTASATRTSTPLPATNTPTATPRPACTPLPTAIATNTPPPTRTSTPTRTPTRAPATSTPTRTATAIPTCTPVPATATPLPATATPPPTSTPTPAGTPQACPCTIWPASSAPVNQNGNDPSSVEVGIKFTSDTSGYVSALRFYKLPVNTGAHIGHLWTATGTLLATATYTNESVSGWQQVTLNPPVEITAGATYVASYFSPGGHYATDQNTFTSTGVNAPPLHALASPSSGGNGVYAYGGSSTFPNNSFSASNYWVDLVFSTTPPPTPTPGPSATPTVTPTPPACPCSLFAGTSSPTNTVGNDPSAVEVGVKFRSDAAGSISAVRFYKLANNAGPHVVSLWSPGGTLLATATASSESASGWQQVNFTTPVPIAANTTYVASYHTNTGGYAVDQNVFTADLNNGVLHAPSTGSSGGNGVYAYSAASTFPNSSFSASNYWVDVVFRVP
jgi:hypothetical protein